MMQDSEKKNAQSTFTMDKDESFGNSQKRSFNGDSTSAKREYTAKQTEALSILRNLRNKV